MQRFQLIFLLIYLPISVVCHGQSSVGVSPPGYLTSLPPEIPSLEYPSDSSKDLPLEINIQWHAQTHTSSYSLQVSKESDFQNLVIDQDNLGILFAISGLENNTTYYWRVSASNVAGESDYSSVWEFTTIVALPNRPVLAEPVDDAVDVPVDTELNWYTSENAEAYSIQVSNLSDFSVLVVDEANHSDTVFSVSGLENNTTYFWRVSASNVAGESDHSSVREFTTIVALPNTPILAEPADHAVGIPIEAELKWHESENAESYSVQVSNLSDFSTLVIDLSNHSDTIFTVSGLQNNTTYFWRVSALNTAGESNYSSVQEFTTIVALPNTPVLAEPADDAVDVPVETELKWHASENAESYSLQVSNFSDFSALLIDRSNHSDTAFSVSGLENNTTYFWRVSALNLAGESNHSSIWSFTTVTATAIEWDSRSKSDGFGLQSAYPNPFNRNTFVKYFLPGQTKILITIYNSMGKSILELESEEKQAGEHTVIWNGRDSTGAPVNNGIYLFMLQTDYGILTQRILFIR